MPMEVTLYKHNSDASNRVVRSTQVFLFHIPERDFSVSILHIES